MFKRVLKLPLPTGQSAFLWGARKTGKSTYLKTFFPGAIYYDFLKSEVLRRFSSSPELFRQEIEALDDAKLQSPIVVDEVQKVPELLNEIHWLIENTNAYFILCGSSARKLRREGVNLLGGRAWRFDFYPLTSREVNNLDLLTVFTNGLLPHHYLQEDAYRSLKAYVADYLKEEIQQEGLVRNLPSFSRFLDVVGFSHGELVNYSNIAQDCGVDGKTIKQYYQILVDTMLGYYVYPYRKRVKRENLISTPKFYLFDVGVANFLKARKVQALKGVEAGDSFEHFILMEIMAYRGLKELDFEVSYWRTKTELEVDFILGPGEVAIEVKVSDHVKKEKVGGLLAFVQEHQPKHAIVVSQDTAARKWTTEEGNVVLVLPWREFLDNLWAGKYI